MAATPYPPHPTHTHLLVHRDRAGEGWWGKRRNREKDERLRAGPGAGEKEPSS